MMTPREYAINVIVALSIVLFCACISMIGYLIPSEIGLISDAMCGQPVTSTTYANGTTIANTDEYFDCSKWNYLQDEISPWLYGAFCNMVLIAFFYAVLSFIYDTYKFLLPYYQNWRSTKCV